MSDIEMIRRGYVVAVLAASLRKVKAGLTYAATTEFQSYPEGCIELGTALDAIDMIAKDIIRCLVLDKCELEDIQQ
jgi:hypothetical protein